VRPTLTLYEKRGIITPKSHRTLLKSHHQIQPIRKPYYRSFKLLSAKMWNFVFFPRRKITNACLFICLFVLFFPQGWSYRSSSPRILWEGSFKRKLKVLVPFLSDQKIWRATWPPPTLIFSRSHPIKISR
jgi:hypothetical protein